MLFNSYTFIFLFLPAALFVYFWLNYNRLMQLSKAWLVFASLFFYSWWNIVYLPLILGSILFNFAVGSTISKTGLSAESKRKVSKKVLLVFGIAGNLLLLGYFKYMDFFIANANMMLGTGLEPMHIILPLGISFFTFTQTAYLVDAYRNEVREMDYLNYTLFVTFFPHLLAGPILHHKEMMPQFDSVRNKVINYKNMSSGLFLFSMGIFKKVVIADTFAVWADNGFETSHVLTFIEAWGTSLSYTVQLYFDFSGYTDMALGAALMFNIRLPINFNSPYKALNIQDFWRRWHITLSRFLRDYIYVPLGGNREGDFRTYSNLFAVFLIGGLWHGASWMFVIWGAMHGLAIVIHRIWQVSQRSMHKVLAWFITFNFINVTWVFFRAEDWKQAINVLSGMAGLQGIVISQKLEHALFFLHHIGVQFGSMNANPEISEKTLYAFLLILLILRMQNSQYYTNTIKYSYRSMITISMMLAISVIMMANGESEFLYFNF